MIDFHVVIGFVCYRCLNNSFQYLNNITCIFTHFFIHMYFQKIQTTLLKQHYQTNPKFWIFTLTFQIELCDCQPLSLFHKSHLPRFFFNSSSSSSSNLFFQFLNFLYIRKWAGHGLYGLKYGFVIYILF